MKISKFLAIALYIHAHTLYAADIAALKTQCDQSISLASKQSDHVKDRLNQARAIHAKIKANTATELDLKKCIFYAYDSSASITAPEGYAAEPSESPAPADTNGPTTADNQPEDNTPPFPYTSPVILSLSDGAASMLYEDWKQKAEAVVADLDEKRRKLQEANEEARSRSKIDANNEAFQARSVEGHWDKIRDIKRRTDTTYNNHELTREEIKEAVYQYAQCVLKPFTGSGTSASLDLATFSRQVRALYRTKVDLHASDTVANYTGTKIRDNLVASLQNDNGTLTKEQIIDYLIAIAIIENRGNRWTKLCATIAPRQPAITLSNDVKIFMFDAINQYKISQKCKSFNGSINTINSTAAIANVMAKVAKCVGWDINRQWADCNASIGNKDNECKKLAYKAFVLAWQTENLDERLGYLSIADAMARLDPKHGPKCLACNPE